MLLYEITDTFEKSKLKYALVGGYALALHGLVRATMDIDFVLSLRLNDFELAEASLEKIGLQTRLPIRAQDVFKMRQEYIETRNLIVWSFVDYANPSRQVDILITKDLRDLEVEKISVGGRKISVVTLRELLRLRKEADLPKVAKSKEVEQVSPEAAVQFLEDIRNMASDIDEATVAISLRVPANVLRAIKTKAKAEGKKYQSLMIDYLRKGLKAK